MSIIQESAAFDFDPVEEVIVHVNQLAMVGEADSIHKTVEHAFDELEAYEIPLTVDTVAQVMHSFFGAPQFARQDYEGYTEREMAVLFPGVTAKLLSWYVTIG